MAEKRMPIGRFVDELRAARDRHDGYIMGAKGQDPKKLSDWYFDQYKDRDEYTEEQEQKALHWKKHAQRVWDCNGLPEGIYQDYTGININTKARYNYATWCNPKGTGMIPVKYRVPGAAVFTGKRAADIPHVMFLDRPVEEGKPEGDWYLIEARGVMHGVVETRLYSRKPTFWGLMTEKFDYDSTEVEARPEKKYALGERLLKVDSPMMRGDDVKEMQERLNALGYNCGEADGDFGKNTEKGVKELQEAANIEVDGEFGPMSLNAMKAAEAALKKPLEVIADEVIDGKWGNGSERRKRLEAAGYNYREVQDKVNSMLT